MKTYIKEKDHHYENLYRDKYRGISAEEKNRLLKSSLPATGEYDRVGMTR